MQVHNTDNCGACRHWAPILRQQFIGVCGSPDRPGDRSTDRVDTCKHFTRGGVRADKMDEALA